jgi:hypothetical protein
MEIFRGMEAPGIVMLVEFYCDENYGDAWYLNYVENEELSSEI